ncbi:hypothetical protein [Streptomyces sp. NPDC086182]|jgi:hypothetical protein|uniref:hypothetical protein n=1 Tax=Streptomyces sp. NPDC086182 TaxID=3155058 RepID=UPI00344941E1
MPAAARAWWKKLGSPSAVVLFRTPLKWRFAVYFTDPDGVLDGGLIDEPADSAPQSAQTAMHGWIEDTFHRSFAVTWAETDKPDWWTGTITSTDQPYSSTPHP